MDFTQITNYLEEKFNVVLDWTSETVFPILKDIAHRVEVAQLTKFSFLSFICLAVMVCCVIYYVCFLKAYKNLNEESIFVKVEHRSYAEDLVYIGDGVVYVNVLVGIISAISFIAFIVCVTQIIEWAIVPEAKLFSYVSSII